MIKTFRKPIPEIRSRSVRESEPKKGARRFAIAFRILKDSVLLSIAADLPGDADALRGANG